MICHYSHIPLCPKILLKFIDNSLSYPDNRQTNEGRNVTSLAEVNESVPANRRLLGVHGGVVHWNSMARKTPLRKPNRGEGIVSTKRKPRSVYDLSWFSVLLHYFMMCLSCPYILMWHYIYSVFVLKVSLNTNQLTN